MSQIIIAAAALIAFALFAVVYGLYWTHRETCRKPYRDVHSGPDDVETRSRRAF